MIRPTRADPARRYQRYVGSRIVDEEEPVPETRPQLGPRTGVSGPPDGHPPGTGARSVPWLARMVARHGWRVYAVPVLVVLTVLAVFDATRSASPAPLNQAGAAGRVPTPLIPNPVGGPGFAAAKIPAELPGGGPFTVQGAGIWRVIPGASPPFGAGQLFTYTVEVENGVELEGGPEGFASTVDSTLHNPKSWIGSGRYRFQRIEDSRAATLRISLTSQQTTRRLCGSRIPFDASCWVPRDHRVVINTARWARGAVAFEGNVVQYQQYVVNHEVGHGLGFSHIACDGPGKLAPVMMQQTWGLSDNYLAVLGTDHV
ncbi:MAG: DUF3152 domain-containing protein, partial [Pseudonocardiaceae bacterium]